MDRTLWRCVNLLGSNESYVEKEARSILLSICERILQSPEDDRFRKLRLNDSTATILLETAGAIESLLECGFVQDDDCFSLPRNASLTKLASLRAILSTDSLRICTNHETGYYVLLPLSATAQGKQMCKRIIENYRSIMRYEDPQLQRMAKRAVPIARLELKTIEKLREVQKNIKVRKLQVQGETSETCYEDGIFVKDIFLMELLHWFKHEFFQWFDKPICSKCSNDCIFSTVKQIKNEHISRIEVFTCNSCNNTESFVRYTDPEPLLHLRRGRCGEWANVFTCLCRAFGYDARLVHDLTDHLWTEVWSPSDNRWIHLDPCENVMDKPLMYEKGWHKKLSYIFGYSKDEVQDVTWRYTRDQENVMKRRTACPEADLVAFIQILNEQRQHTAGYSAARRRYVAKRDALEFAGMLYLPGQKDSQSEDVYEERHSGSYAWRLARREVSEKNVQEDSTWNIPKDVQSYELQYFIVKNVYKVFCDSSLYEERSSWQAGATVTEGNIFRKVENDWKMVYLARTEDSERAEICWNIEVKDPNLRIDNLHLRAHTTVYHDAEISWEIVGFDDNESRMICTDPIRINDSSDFVTNKLKGAMKINIRAILIGGEGHLAWQHAQLFRQRLQNEEEECMVISIRLYDRRTL